MFEGDALLLDNSGGLYPIYVIIGVQRRTPSMSSIALLKSNWLQRHNEFSDSFRCLGLSKPNYNMLLSLIPLNFSICANEYFKLSGKLSLEQISCSNCFGMLANECQPILLVSTRHLDWLHRFEIKCVIVFHIMILRLDVVGTGCTFDHHTKKAYGIMNPLGNGGWIHAL